MKKTYLYIKGGPNLHRPKSIALLISIVVLIAVICTFSFLDKPKSVKAEAGTCAFAGNHAGTLADPIEIDSMDCLQAMGTNAESLSKSYKLVDNLNATGVDFQPIGQQYWDGNNYVGQFTGNFDGNGKTIDNLTINIPDGNEMSGLFGTVGTYDQTSSIIKNIGLTNINISAGDYTDSIGGLVGYNFGTITNSYSTGSIIGNRSNRVGGLVGENDGTINSSYSTVNATYNSSIGTTGGLVGENDGTITNSYSTGSVTSGSGSWGMGSFVGSNYRIINNSYSTGNVISGSGSDSTGGFAGYNADTINSSYSTGNVTSGSGSSKTGGFVGYNGNTITNSYSTASVTGGINSTAVGGFVGLSYGSGTISSNYWLNNSVLSDIGSTYDQNWSVIPLGDVGGVSAVGAVQMKQHYTFQGWSFPPTANNVWKLEENNTYPKLAWQADAVDRPSDIKCGGTGTHDDPYMICNMNELQNMRINPGASYRLTKDLSATGYPFQPIGYYDNSLGDKPFTGTFDGGNFTISDLYIPTDVTNYAGKWGTGLFGELNNAAISNLNLGVEISASNSTGAAAALASYANNSTFTNIHVSGNVLSEDGEDVAGFLGNMYGGSIIDCSANVSANSTQGYASGFIMSVDSATIERSYSLGDVSAGYDAAGFIANASNSIFTNNYSRGAVAGGSNIGGFVAYSYSSTFTNNYSVGAVTGAGSYKGGFVGYDYLSSFDSNYWLGNGLSNSGSNGDISGIAAKDAEQLKQHITYAPGASDDPNNWSFPGTWKLDDDVDYPKLAWQPGAVENAVTYTIDATVSNANSTLSPSGLVHIYKGGSQEFSFAGIAPFYISSIVVDGISQGEPLPSTYTFNNINKDHTLSIIISVDGAKTWTGFGDTNNWSEAANWSGNTVPMGTDIIMFNGTGTKDAIIDAAFAQNTINSLNMDSGYTGTITQNKNLIISGGFSLVSGTFAGTASWLQCSGAFAQVGGIFTAPSVLNVAGPF
ncbi:MAG: GLUG motif-containing protein, partial [bacterium]